MNNSEVFWNNLSKNYDKKAKDEAYKLIVKQSKGFLTINDAVLDFGSATGLYSFAHSKNVNEIHAFDTSSEMINMAKDQKHVDKINNLKFHSMKGLEKTIMDCGFKIIETSVLIDKPATEYFIVAQKL